MTAKEIPPRRRPGAGCVVKFSTQKYPPPSIKAQVCVTCGTAHHVMSSGRCRCCFAFLMHYRACQLLREVVS